MRNLLILLLLFSATALGAQCNSWAEKVAQRWRSIFVSDDDFSLNDDVSYDTRFISGTLPPWEMQLSKSYLDDASISEMSITETEPKIPPKFKRTIRKEEAVSKRGDELQDLRENIDNIVKTHWEEFHPLLERIFLDEDIRQEWEKIIQNHETRRTERPKKAQRKVAISIDL